MSFPISEAAAVSPTTLSDDLHQVSGGPQREWLRTLANIWIYFCAQRVQRQSQLLLGAPNRYIPFGFAVKTKRRKEFGSQN